MMDRGWKLWIVLEKRTILFVAMDQVVTRCHRRLSGGRGDCREKDDLLLSLLFYPLLQCRDGEERRIYEGGSRSELERQRRIF